MNREEFVGDIAARAGVSKRLAGKCLDAATESVAAVLESGGAVRLAGFGTFEVKYTAAKVGRNPQTNEPVPIPPRRAPVFKAGSRLRARVSGGRTSGG